MTNQNKPNKKSSKDLVRENSDLKELKSIDLVQIEQELREVDPKIFDGIKADKKNEILATVVRRSIIQKSHSGPIPDPESLAHYNQIIPNAADRILKMAEKQQTHRINMEDKMVSSQIKQSEMGQYFALLLALVGLSAATYLGLNGKETIGSIIGGTTVISLVSIFVLRKITKVNEKENTSR